MQCKACALARNRRKKANKEKRKVDKEQKKANIETRNRERSHQGTGERKLTRKKANKREREKEG